MTDIELMDLKNYLNLLGFKQNEIKRIVNNPKLVDLIFYQLRYYFDKRSTKEIISSLIKF